MYCRVARETCIGSIDCSVSRGHCRENSGLAINRSHVRIRGRKRRNFGLNKELARGPVVVQSPDFKTDYVADSCRDLIWMEFNSGEVCTWWNRRYENWVAKDQMPSCRIIR